MADPNSSRLLASERRRARRHPATRLPKVYASILAGPDVKILDVSPQGLLVESNVRLTPGAGICLTIKFENESYMVGGRVARVDTAVAGSQLTYRAGIALDGEFAPFDLPTPPAKHSQGSGTSAATPKSDGVVEKNGESCPPAPLAHLDQSGVDGLRAALDEQRRNQEHGLRVIEMLKAALRASERSRKDAEEDRTRKEDSWQRERQTLEQALEMAARHKEKLSETLTASTTRERALTKELNEARAADLAHRSTLQEQLDAANGRCEDTIRDLNALRESHQLLERTLDEERAMLAGLLQEKERLLAELEGLRPTLAALSNERERANDDRLRGERERERLSQQLEAAERWCADQHELIYELWQQTLRSTSLLEGWKSSEGHRGVVSHEKHEPPPYHEGVAPVVSSRSAGSEPEPAPATPVLVSHRRLVSNRS